MIETEERKKKVKLFLRFLKENNARKSYIAKCKGNEHSAIKDHFHGSIKKFLLNTMFSHYIIGAFVWDDIDYWSDLNKKWMNYYEKN